MVLKLAWRNLWRNKPRTFITMGAVFLAVILSTLMMSLKEGVYENMIGSLVGTFSGYAQVHANGYWEDKTLDYSMVLNDTAIAAIEGTAGVTGWVPRISTFALAAGEVVTQGSIVVGADPRLEAKFNGLDGRVVEGEYFEPNDRAVLIGSGLADYLQVAVGDSLVLLGQGYQGVSANALYPIKGIVKFGSPQLSKQLVFLPFEEAQSLYNMQGMCSSVILEIAEADKAASIAQHVGEALGPNYQAMDWIQLNPDLITTIETDRAEGLVFMMILYMVISFGIFGTTLMMLSERKYEFGVLVAVGMKRIKLASMVWLEVIIISLMGALAGVLGALPTVLWLHLSPIQLGDEMSDMMEEYGMEAVLQTSLAPSIFIQQALVVVAIASVISIYPFLKLIRLNAIKAMRS